MEIYVYWIVLALALVGLEIVTGTFYLLVIGIALTVGGAAAALGLALAWQFVFSAAAGVAGTITLQRWKNSQISRPPEVSLDIGLPVKIIKWNNDGSARVHYRGAEWNAEPESPDTPREGTLYIKAMHGTGLILTHHKQ